MVSSTRPAPWWAREGLAYVDGSLHLGRHDLAALADAEGTPMYAYDGARVGENLARLRGALEATGLPHRIHYAMKSNRSLPLLAHLRAGGGCGVDVCSPGEARRALDAGFAEADLSFTGTSLSRRDLDALAALPGMHVNLDSVSALRALGARCPGREVGIRLNPGVGLGYRDDDRLLYAGERPTKFGIHADALDGALAAAREAGLAVRHVHVHAGCGYLTPQLHRLREVLTRVAEMAARVPDLRSLNLGGGLGIPLVPDDAPLDLAAWGEVVRDTVGGLGVEIRVEPGDYIAKDAGVLVVEVTYVETKGGVEFVGVDAGFNLHPEPAFYGLPCWIVPVAEPGPDAGAPRPVTVVGNINEALDEWGRDVPLPPLEEGDRLALLNAGGYGASMSSNHCIRGEFAERFLP